MAVGSATWITSANDNMKYKGSINLQPVINTTDMSLGSRLNTIRKEHKIGPGRSGRKGRLHANVLGRYEREEATPSVDVAEKIADALGISLN